MPKSLELQLPFRGSWFVLEGGDATEQKPQNSVGAQEYALHFVRPGDVGRLLSDDTQNENYSSYDEDVLAVADGEVVKLVDNEPENHPGEVPLRVLLGNFVMLRHAPDLFSIVAHLQPDSIQVGPGQMVEAGRLLGACGNSGSSPSPRLHFQLQDTPDHTPFTAANYLHTPLTSGIQAVFRNIVIIDAAGLEHPTASYSPLKGDRVRAQARTFPEQ